MKVLVVNCGSSSIKYQLYDISAQRAVAKGIVGNIGEEDSYLEHQVDEQVFRQAIPIQNHRSGFDIIINTLLNKERGVISEISDVCAVGHRIAHGGSDFTESTLLTEDVVKKIEKIIPLAPLHNPANLLGVSEAKRLLPDVPHVAVFDTTFHQTMPPRAYLYALPYEYYEKYRIRRYGFHGTSCRYVSRQAAKLLGKPIENLKMIICHLGNGVTLAAVDGGKSIDTSMGFTPLEGLMMGTRAGDIDPGVIFHLYRESGLSIDQIDSLLNRESGLLGISGISNDMRKIVDEANNGNESCQLALDMFTYRIKKYIGAYAAALGGLDALVFTAGIGENSPLVREKICNGLEFLGISLDNQVNKNIEEAERIISGKDSTVQIIVIPTDEEQMIVLDTLSIAGLTDQDLPD